MLSWSIPKWGIEHLVLEEGPIPGPGPDQALVRIQAATLNYRDLLVIKGLYNPRFPLPLVPGSDAFGQIVEVGSNLSKSLLNRFVVTTFAPQWHSGPPQKDLVRQTMGGPLEGIFCEYRLFCPQEFVLLEEPSALTPAEWASLPCAGVTAWNALIGHGGLQPGQTVVLIGTGGVSIFGLQIARMASARTLLLSSSKRKRERALELGADAAADYREIPDWSEWVLKETEGQGADIVLETGGSGTLKQSLRSVKIGGLIALIGVVSGSQDKLNIMPILMKAIRVQGVIVGSRQHLQDLIRAYMRSSSRPIIDKIFARAELPTAVEYLASGQHFGKVAISFLEP